MAISAKLNPIHPGFFAKILVAEDNPVNQIITQENLKALGCIVDVANDGQDAVEKWSDNDYDLICMDCAMPRMDGLEATREIRKREEYIGEHITIVALTAHVQSENRNECLDAGMDDFMGKPFTREELEGMLARWIKEAQEKKEAKAAKEAKA